MNPPSMKYHTKNGAIDATQTHQVKAVLLVKHDQHQEIPSNKHLCHAVKLLCILIKYPMEQEEHKGGPYQRPSTGNMKKLQHNNVRSGTTGIFEKLAKSSHSFRDRSLRSESHNYREHCIHACDSGPPPFVFDFSI